MKYAAFKLAGVALSLSLAWTSAQAAALRVAFALEQQGITLAPTTMDKPDANQRD